MMHDVSDGTFDESTLRDAIVETWGVAGAHVDVYDALARRAGLRTFRGEEISIMANAIGFAIGAAEGRPVRDVNGVQTIDSTVDEAKVHKAAAERAWDQLHDYRRGAVE